MVSVLVDRRTMRLLVFCVAMVLFCMESYGVEARMFDIYSVGEKIIWDNFQTIEADYYYNVRNSLSGEINGYQNIEMIYPVDSTTGFFYLYKDGRRVGRVDIFPNRKGFSYKLIDLIDIVNNFYRYDYELREVVKVDGEIRYNPIGTFSLSLGFDSSFSGEEIFIRDIDSLRTEYQLRKNKMLLREVQELHVPTDYVVMDVQLRTGYLSDELFERSYYGPLVTDKAVIVSDNDIKNIDIEWGELLTGQYDLYKGDVVVGQLTYKQQRDSYSISVDLDTSEPISKGSEYEFEYEIYDNDFRIGTLTYKIEQIAEQETIGQLDKEKVTVYMDLQPIDTNEFHTVGSEMFMTFDLKIGDQSVGKEFFGMSNLLEGRYQIKDKVDIGEFVFFNDMVNINYDTDIEIYIPPNKNTFAKKIDPIEITNSYRLYDGSDHVGGLIHIIGLSNPLYFEYGEVKDINRYYGGSQYGGIELSMPDLLEPPERIAPEGFDIEKEVEIPIVGNIELKMVVERLVFISFDGVNYMSEPYTLSDDNHYSGSINFMLELKKDASEIEGNLATVLNLITDSAIDIDFNLETEFGVDLETMTDTQIVFKNAQEILGGDAILSYDIMLDTFEEEVRYKIADIGDLELDFEEVTLDVQTGGLIAEKYKGNVVTSFGDPVTGEVRVKADSMEVIRQLKSDGSFGEELLFAIGPQGSDVEFFVNGVKVYTKQLTTPDRLYDLDLILPVENVLASTGFEDTDRDGVPDETDVSPDSDSIFVSSDGLDCSELCGDRDCDIINGELECKNCPTDLYYFEGLNGCCVNQEFCSQVTRCAPGYPYLCKGKCYEHRHGLYFNCMDDSPMYCYKYLHNAQPYAACAPSEWTCQVDLYNSIEVRGSGPCNCECGVYDPDCDTVPAGFSCRENELCGWPGECMSIEERCGNNYKDAGEQGVDCGGKCEECTNINMFMSALLESVDPTTVSETEFQSIVDDFSSELANYIEENDITVTDAEFASLIEIQTERFRGQYFIREESEESEQLVSDDCGRGREYCIGLHTCAEDCSRITSCTSRHYPVLCNGKCYEEHIVSDSESYLEEVRCTDEGRFICEVSKDTPERVLLRINDKEAMLEVFDDISFHFGLDSYVEFTVINIGSNEIDLRVEGIWGEDEDGELRKEDPIKKTLSEGIHNIEITTTESKYSQSEEGAFTEYAILDTLLHQEYEIEVGPIFNVQVPEEHCVPQEWACNEDHYNDGICHCECDILDPDCLESRFVSGCDIGEICYMNDPEKPEGYCKEHCSDGIKNGDEEGVDCGGSCENECDCHIEPCQDGFICNEDGSCSIELELEGLKCKEDFDVFEDEIDCQTLGDDWSKEDISYVNFDVKASPKWSPTTMLSGWVIEKFVKKELFNAAMICTRLIDYGEVGKDTKCPVEELKEEYADEMEEGITAWSFEKWYSWLASPLTVGLVPGRVEMTVDVDAEEFELAERYEVEDVHILGQSEACKSFVYNGEQEDKADLFFILDTEERRIHDIALLQNILGLNEKQRDLDQGFFQTEPFKSNMDKFNIWYLRTTPQYEQETTIGELTTQESSKYIIDYEKLVLGGVGPSGKQPSNADATGMKSKYCPWADYTIIISDQPFRSNCGLGQDSICKVSIYDEEYPGRLLTHELGHGIGMLGDEYYRSSELKIKDVSSISTTPFDNTGFINCLNNEEEAISEWGGVAENIGEWRGCGGDCGERCTEFIRPTERSIMNDQTQFCIEGDEGCGPGELFYPFNQVSIVQIEKELEKYS